MELNDFLDKLRSNVTMGGRIQTGINDDRLMELMENSINEFKQSDDRCNITSIMIIKHDYFAGTEAYIKNRIITLPKCVLAVTKCVRSERQNLGSYVSNIDGDFRQLNSLYGGMSGGGVGGGGGGAKGGGGSDLLVAIGRASFRDFVGRLSLDTVAFDFSEFSHQMFIAGGDLFADLILEVGIYLSDQAIYGMKDYLDYVTGTVLMEFVSVTNLTTITLLGGEKMSTLSIEKSATKMLDRIEKKWEAQQGENDFIVEF